MINNLLRNCAIFTTSLMALAAYAGCGDNGAARTEAPDAAPMADATPTTDAPAFTKPMPFAIPLASAGPDQLQSVVASGAGWYAAGFTATTVAGEKTLTLVKLTDTGLDTSFGAGGIVQTDIVVSGAAGEIDLAVAANGKLLVSTTVPNAQVANDRDVAVLQFLASGQPDTSFGTNGVVRLDLSTSTTANNTDAARGLALASNGAIYVYAQARAAGTDAMSMPRADRDLVVLKLNSSGGVETAFANNTGRFIFDVQNVSETARGILLADDDGVYISGYANSPGVGSTQPLLLKLKANGTLDTAFAQNGIFHDAVLAIQTEIYRIAKHGDALVTGGYGRASGDTNDFVSLRFNATTGARDLAWGQAGAAVFDPTRMMLADNCRGVVGLADGRTVMYGSAGPANMPTQDAAAVVLNSTGALDATVGALLFPLGANGNDQFWGGAANGKRVMLVGYQGGGMAQSDVNNDNAYAVMLTLP